MGEALHITIEYLTTEERVVMANSKVDSLEAENSTLRKELILAMDSGNKMKEQVKALTDNIKAKKMLTKQKDEQLQEVKREASVAGENVVQAFQLTSEYNIVLLSLYFKGFELLKRYLVKHNPSLDLEDMDFETVDKEMEADETTVSKDVVPGGDVDKGAADDQDDPITLLLC